MSTYSELSSPMKVFQINAMDSGALDNLGTHLAQCMPARRAMHRLGGIFEAMNEFILPRLLTSITGMGAMAAALLYLAL